MRVKTVLIPHMVLVTLTSVVAAAVWFSPPAHATPATKNRKVYLLLQNTVWAANHRLIITPTLMQLDAEHQGFLVQYSVPDQMVYAWHKGRREYAKEPLNSWLKSFRNLAVLLGWTSGLSKPNEITTVKEWDRKAKLYVFDDVKIVRSYYASDIGKPERTKIPATGHIKTIQLDGVDPNVGVVLTRLYGFPEYNEIPIEAYIIRNKKKTRSSVHTIKLDENPEIELPSEFIPPKEYKLVKDFQRVIAPMDSDINGIF
jgi:hypothetical protein